MNLDADNLLEPRSVYIHVPFCRHRCGYCNFTLVAGRDYLADRFLAAIEKEIERELRTVELQRSQETDQQKADPPLETLYLGGGTPSHLSPSQLLRLHRVVDAHFHVSSDTEFTVECNPADIGTEKVAALSAIGVNRISLGVQSFNNAKLERLERDHDRATVQQAMKLVREFCDNISIDLIFATDGETLDDWQQDLQNAIELSPQHLSAYELTYEKGTSFWNRMKRQELVPLDDDLRSQMYQATINGMAKNQFEHYEISSFAKPGRRSRHNQVYWSGKPFFAFGPGASSLLGNVRKTNYRSTTRYLKAVESGESAVAEVDQLSPRQRALEMLAVGLRQRDGLAVDAFQRMHGVSPIELAGPFLERFTEHRFMEVTEDRIRLSEAGIFVADWIAEQLLSEN